MLYKNIKSKTGRTEYYKILLYGRVTITIIAN